jgi:hypothetical protein
MRGESEYLRTGSQQGNVQVVGTDVERRILFILFDLMVKNVGPTNLKKNQRLDF